MNDKASQIVTPPHCPLTAEWVKVLVNDGMVWSLIMEILHTCNQNTLQTNDERIHEYQSNKYDN